jgi:hypothetical protein
MIKGYGEWGSENYSVAAIASDSTCLIAYLIAGSEVTVDLSKISGKEARCWWFNPRSGEAFESGVFPASGLKVFAKPTNDDWVMVIDNAACNFPPPGASK